MIARANRKTFSFSFSFSSSSNTIIQNLNRLTSRARNTFGPPPRAPSRHRSFPRRLRISNAAVPPTLRLLLIISTFRHEGRPGTNRRTIKQQNDRNNAQSQTNEPKQTRSPLEPQIRVQRLRRKRQESAKSVAAQRRRRQGGSGVLFVGVREIVDDRHVDFVNAQTDARNPQGRHDPVHVAVRRPPVPEHAGREDQRARDGEVQAGFGHGLAGFLFVVLRGAEVEHVLDRVDEGADDGAAGEGELYESRLEGAEAVECGEDLGDAALEEEEDSPSETHPEGKGDDDEFGYQHFGWPLEGHFEHLGHACLVELGFGVGVAALLAQVLGPACQDDIAAGFFQDEPEEWQESCVRDELDL